MGRTVPSYRQALEMEIARWEGFRRALRDKETEAFDMIMNTCRMHASAASMATRPIITDAMFMSILLAQQRQLAEMEKRLRQLATLPEQDEPVPNQTERQDAHSTSSLPAKGVPP